MDISKELNKRAVLQGKKCVALDGRKTMKEDNNINNKIKNDIYGQKNRGN